MSIRQEVQQELSNLDLDEEITHLALDALVGEDETKRVLASGEANVPEEPVGAEAQVPPIFLQDITVTGFRGIGPETKLKILPGPGLTVVVGRNGSGKSSFSEALEVLLTGYSYRWKDKPKALESGWENIHQDDSPKITARFQVEGMNKLTKVKRTFKGSGIADSKVVAKHNGQACSDLSEIGWEAPLDLYRPILSYNELSMVESSPTALHDILAKVLSIRDLSFAAENLRQSRLKQQHYKNEVLQDLNQNILPALDDSEDERAIKVKEALAKRTWDLKVITDLCLESGADHKILQDIMNLTVPDEKEVIKAAEDIDLAYTSLSNISSTEIESTERVMELLEIAVRHYELHHENQPCPVCRKGTLDDNWYKRTLKQIKQLKDITQDYRKAEDDSNLAVDKARQLATPPNLPYSDMIKLDRLDLEWKQWSLFPDNLNEISEHFRSQYYSVKMEQNSVSKQAEQIFSEREKKWIAISSKLLEWVSKAQNFNKAKSEIAKIEKAEKAFKTVTDNIRTRRWKPIESKALNLWNDLRLESNVNLCSVELTGRANKRRVDLQVDVDGIEAEALSVISQGELSCLALSLFFPRVMLPASPFRFIVIDDPIQSMDLARVRALARVFAKIAEDRQLIVFTHDVRLSESLRIFSISHRCLTVTRDRKSEVRIEETRDPVEQSFKDAKSIKGDKNLPKDMARQVIPGLCRIGLEAACVEVIWRNLGKTPDTTTPTRKKISRAYTLNRKAFLALFCKEGNNEDKVLTKIQDQWGEKSKKTYEKVNGYNHPNIEFDTEFSDDDLSGFIDDCKCLAQKIRSYKIL